MVNFFVYAELILFCLVSVGIFDLVRAFSYLFGKFLVPMKLGKKCVIWGKDMTILGENSAIFSKIKKVYTF